MKVHHAGTLVALAAAATTAVPTATGTPGPAPSGEDGAATSKLVGAVDARTERSGGMYVWTIEFRTAGPHLTSTVTIHHDADRDGVAEFYDDPVPDATVDVSLRRDGDGNAHFDCETDDCRSLTGTTGIDGEVELTWRSAPSGDYEAEVTALTHPGFSWESRIETDDRAYVTVP